MQAVDAQLVLTPSGTDAEMLMTSAAAARAYALYGPPSAERKLFSFMTAAGEVGSGSTLASGGKHFNRCTPDGNTVPINEYILGFDAASMEVREYAARDVNGEFTLCDEAVAADMASIFLETPSAVILLHVVASSKTGGCSMSWPIVKDLTQLYRRRVIVVVDACQMRSPDILLQFCIENEYNVLITGSKYYAGSPFSGGVIFSKICIQEMESALSHENEEVISSIFPAGFSSYFCKDEYPLRMTNLRSHASQKLNVGLWLRWEAALCHMEKHALIPAEVRWTAVSKYMTGLEALLTGSLPTGHTLRCIPSIAAEPVSTIISFQIFSGTKKQYLNHAELQHLHKVLTLDLTSLQINSDEDLNSDKEQDDVVLSQRCILGQPVKLNAEKSVVRIAVSATMIITMCLNEENKLLSTIESDACIEVLLQQDAILLQKLSWILSHWEITASYVLEGNL